MTIQYIHNIIRANDTPEPTNFYKFIDRHQITSGQFIISINFDEYPNWQTQVWLTDRQTYTGEMQRMCSTTQCPRQIIWTICYFIILLLEIERSKKNHFPNRFSVRIFLRMAWLIGCTIRKITTTTARMPQEYHYKWRSKNQSNLKIINSLCSNRKRITDSRKLRIISKGIRCGRARVAYISIAASL